MSMDQTILILDDQPDITGLFEDYIAMSCEVNIITSNVPAEAMGIVESTKLCLIVTDHLMPGMSGIQFVRSIRGSQGINKACPVIIFTGMETEVKNELEGLIENVTVLDKLSKIDEIVEVVGKFID